HAAYLAATGDRRLGSITLLNTLLDYSNPGVLGAFTDELTVSRLERQMEEQGVLEGRQMATTFDALRPNDLIFNYVVSNWLPGPAGPRHPGLDQRQPPHARRDARVLPALAVPAQRTGPRHHGGQGAAVVARRRHQRRLRGRCRQRPHRALVRVLQDDRADGRGRPLRALQRRPHPRDREPAPPPTLVPAGQPTESRDRGPVAGGRQAARRVVVGGLGQVGGTAGRPPRRTAADGQRAVSG